MKALAWVAILACLIGIVALLSRLARRQAERRRDGEARAAAFLAQSIAAARGKARTPGTSGRD